jgi:Restriction endonuclease AspBHI N-terminal/Restriction endonuclease
VNADRRYRLGHDYRDLGRANSPDDQFLAWINLDGRGIRNMGGVRTLGFASLRLPVHAAIILVTNEGSTGSTSNPWDDLVDIPHGRIVYWGDAKFHESQTVDDFVGNRALRNAWDQVLDGQMAMVPPILHFSRRDKSVIRFNGLCVLDRLELTWYEHHGRPVRNYRAHLTILDEEFVDPSWLHSRMQATSVSELYGHGPKAWVRYQDGAVDRLRVWAPVIRSTAAQLPTVGSGDARVLNQLVGLTPTGFEAAVVALLRELDEVRHNITRTRPTADGGFDFFGQFTLPPPIQYDIPFRGEAKKYARTTAVGPKDVSRLVARLGRGQYGIFVTTSYFSRQTQEEVLEDQYPTKLVAGADLVRIMRETRVARGDSISPSWLRAVEEEVAGVVDLQLVAEEPAPYGD